MSAKRIFYTALVWIVCAVAHAFFPKWGFQFASGLWTGVYWGPWFTQANPEGGK